MLEAEAFYSTARVRHVSLDVGFRTVSPQVWRYCHSLRIVKLPDTVVAIGYAAFQGCYSLQIVEMPGCVELGALILRVLCAGACWEHHRWNLLSCNRSYHRAICL